MSAIKRTFPLGFPWETVDPFLFCVHHEDHYPAGTAQLGPPPETLRGRDLGQDFTVKDGWRMYHGQVVPGFPQHPHRGFETVTIARRGYIDHSDSLGAAARFGDGDVQWLTAGAGIVHSEMFPLLKNDAPNPAELFQIWLNLPAADKMAPPHFAMLWKPEIPTVKLTDEAGRVTEVTVVAGRFEGRTPPSPPPRSWASRPDSDVAIWSIKMSPGAHFMLPPAADRRTRRTIYFFSGPSLSVDGQVIGGHAGLELDSQAQVSLVAGDGAVEILLLQGRPIAEPVAQYGPFVMNTRAELQQAFVDYQRTQFGGWPWPADDPNHGPERGRFARHADGRVEDKVA